MGGWGEGEGGGERQFSSFVVSFHLMQVGRTGEATGGRFSLSEYVAISH